MKSKNITLSFVIIIFVMGTSFLLGFSTGDKNVSLINDITNKTMDPITADKTG